MPRWKTKITIDITVATAVKNFLENYAEIYGLPSPGRNVNRITQSLTLSIVFDGIKRLNKGKKHLKVTCDNAGGQNKNNATI
jgi:hypothetical protein